MSKNLVFEYVVSFERTEKTYRLIHYSTPWDNERELEDISLMFDGKDLTGTKLSGFKTIAWENLAQGKYKIKVNMHLVKQPKSEEYRQYFRLLGEIQSV